MPRKKIPKRGVHKCVKTKKMENLSQGRSNGSQQACSDENVGSKKSKVNESKGNIMKKKKKKKKEVTWDDEEYILSRVSNVYSPKYIVRKKNKEKKKRRNERRKTKKAKKSISTHEAKINEDEDIERREKLLKEIGLFQNSADPNSSNIKNDELTDRFDDLSKNEFDQYCEKRTKEEEAKSLKFLEDNCLSMVSEGASETKNSKKRNSDKFSEVCNEISGVNHEHLGQKDYSKFIK